jgi:parallel beta-helix repeat protein
MRRPLFACVAGGLLVAGVVGVTARAGANDPTVVVVESGQSIQAAIDAAHQHTTIVVRPGTYAENLLITTDRITLLGQGATLVPPATPGPGTLCDFRRPGGTNGICAAGASTPPTPTPPKVTDYLTDVTITGFTVQGFPGSGIIFLGARNPVVTQSTDGQRWLRHRPVLLHRWPARRQHRQRIGRGRHLRRRLTERQGARVGNKATDNHLFGIFLRDAMKGTVVGNEASGNCVGHRPRTASGRLRHHRQPPARQQRVHPAGGDEG